MGVVLVESIQDGVTQYNFMETATWETLFAHSFSERIAVKENKALMKRGFSFVLVDLENRTQQNYMVREPLFHEGYASGFEVLGRSGGFCDVINEDLELVATECSEVRLPNSYKYGVVQVTKENRITIINVQGQAEISFDNYIGTPQGNSAVLIQRGDKFAYLDPNFRILGSFWFDCLAPEIVQPVLRPSDAVEVIQSGSAYLLYGNGSSYLLPATEGRYVVCGHDPVLILEVIKIDRGCKLRVKDTHQWVTFETIPNFGRKPFTTVVNNRSQHVFIDRTLAELTSASHHAYIYETGTNEWRAVVSRGAQRRILNLTHKKDETEWLSNSDLEALKRAD